ncbi:TerD family protein [Gordonia paraffinivorans]|uniref:TerD family protein n=1 Tax=Gordonia paraffinivorans TaxID=175628 RepID=UPI001E4B4742|nr:TerD family protein [Gordonia paraffinivorans]MCD2144553.1 TerD family protein [Gordonia paraffinivorans]
MNGISGKPGMLVAKSGAPDSRKLQTARDKGIPIFDEDTALRLPDRVLPGTLRSVEVVEVLPRPATTLTPKRSAAKPWSGRRVPVLGGSHTEASSNRSRITQLGAVPAVNFTGGVTHVLVLDGGHSDRRLQKAYDRQVPILEMHLDTVTDENTKAADESTASQASAPLQPSPTVLTPGAVMDLASGIIEIHCQRCVVVRTDQSDVDVVAFELDRYMRVPSDDEFDFYNQPESLDVAAKLRIDGDREQGIAIDLSVVGEDIDRIMVGAATDGATFGDLGALSVTVDTTQFTFATAVFDAATTEKSMIITEVYRRNGVWRLRALGQG